MNRTMLTLHTARTALFAAALAAPAAAQDTEPETTTDARGAVAARWSALRERLDAPPPSDPAEAPERPLADRASRLESFLDEAEAQLAAEPSTADRAALHEARCRLARIELALLRPDTAQRLFESVLDAEPAASLDLRGIAAHGRALALELQALALHSVEPDTARRAHDAVVRQFVGTRYADWSRAALARLEDRPGARAEVGQPLPGFGRRTDIAGRVRRLADGSGEPLLLCVWSAGDAAGLKRVRELTRIARDGGLDDDALLHVALHADARIARRTAHDTRLPGIVLPSAGETLDPVVLLYQIPSTPTWLLVGPDGRLLARNPPPARLAELLRELVR